MGPPLTPPIYDAYLALLLAAAAGLLVVLLAAAVGLYPLERRVRARYGRAAYWFFLALEFGAAPAATALAVYRFAVTVIKISS